MSELARKLYAEQQARNAIFRPAKVIRPVRIVERVAPKRKAGEFRVPAPAAIEPAPTRQEILFAALGRVRIIQDVTCEFYGFTRNDLVSARRSVPVVWARQVSQYIAKELTPLSLPQIGKRYGGRDHTTVLHAVKKITRLIAESPWISSEVATIKAACEAAIEAASRKAVSRGTTEE